MMRFKGIKTGPKLEIDVKNAYLSFNYKHLFQ